MTIEAIHQLIRQQRWAALATLGESGPIASQVAYAVDSDNRGILLHLSELAAHTRALLHHPVVSLSITEPDDGREDPQTLARVTLFGRAVAVKPTDSDYGAARERYLDRLPAADRLFALGDFHLFRIHIDKARYVGGFGAARTVGGEALWTTGSIGTR